MSEPKPSAAPRNRFIARDLACVRGGRLLFSGLGFTLSPGDVLALTGPNGSGKSSLLRLLAGLLPAARGTVEYPAETERLSYLGHGDGLKPLATVGESLAFWAKVGGPRPGAPSAAAIGRALGLFDLTALAALPCRYLSAGQRRRVALARVLVTAAPLWLLDEPTTALDSAGTAAFGEALAAHSAAGGIAVVATHAPLTQPGAQSLELTDFIDPAMTIGDPFDPAPDIEARP
ncbi:MAG: heme ABC exporter ATP-binding protein CcmA [Alphaproteobacteria bacterium]|nr:heme ABC exporter ATP-binding protein CcmA [Alphaproteobacteria bacterium]